MHLAIAPEERWIVLISTRRFFTAPPGGRNEDNYADAIKEFMTGHGYYLLRWSSHLRSTCIHIPTSRDNRISGTWNAFLSRSRRDTSG